MADSFSFDIVSRVDMQEVKNAVDQAQRELSNRWDFKGSKSEIEYEKDKLTLISDDDFKLTQLRDIVETKLLKRGVDIRQIDYDEPQKAGGMTLRQAVNLKVGIPQDQAKELVRKIKDSKLKVQSQIQGDEVRVTAKVKDDLQKTIAFVKGLELPYPVEFVNYR